LEKKNNTLEIPVMKVKISSCTKMWWVNLFPERMQISISQYDTLRASTKEIKSFSNNQQDATV